MNSMLLRPAFSNQNGQCLIIDVADINVEFLNNVIKAAQDVLALSCSIRGGVRIPAFSLSVLTKGVTELFEFDAIRGSFNQILSALNSIITYCQINEEFQPQDYKDSLYQVIDSIIRTLTIKQGKNDWINISQIEITFITVKDSQILKSFIQTFIQDMEISKIFRIVIIELQYMEHAIIENKNGLIHTIIMNGANHIQIQAHFKSWLLDQGTEIGAILHLPGRNTSNLSIKCDIFECIINPLSLTFGHRFYLQTDCLSVEMTGISITKTATSNVPVYELNILNRISSDAICESTLYGLPMCLRPSKSWRLSVEEEKENQEYFTELCKQLSDCDQFLFVQTKSHFQTDQFSPYFVLTPGDCCLLMKSFSSSELTLPWKQENLNNEVSTENSLKILNSLQNLKILRNLDPNTYECGLFSALKANLKHARRDTSFDREDLQTSKRYKRNKQ